MNPQNENSYSGKPQAEKESQAVQQKTNESPVNYREITDILKTEEGKPNAENVMNAFVNREASDAPACPADAGGSRLAACVLYFLHAQDFNCADKILSALEKINTGPCTRFLRGEYYFLRGITEKAQQFYHEAAVKDKLFWPALYRIAVLAAEGNRTRYEYKIKKTIESIDLLQDLKPSDKHNYECFMGGFSPDYFRKILEKKLT